MRGLNWFATLTALLVIGAWVAGCAPVGVSNTLDAATDTTLQARCVGYETALESWEAYRLQGGTLTPERELYLAGIRTVLAVKCPPEFAPSGE